MKNLFKNFYFKLFYLFILGVISSFSLPPYNYFVINFFTLSLFFIFLIKVKVISKNKFNYFGYGWAFGFGYFLSSLYWISIALTFDENFKVLIPISLILIPALLGIFYGISTYIFSYFLKKETISLLLIFSIILSIVEFIRGSILTGFPWNLLAFSFSNNLNFIQILSIIGTYGFNLICISLFLIPAAFILRKSNNEIIVCLFFILLSITFLTYGNKRLNGKNTILSKKNEYLIKIVSPKIDIKRFYNIIYDEEIIIDLIELSEPKSNIPTIFIWPEGILSNDLENIKKYKDIFLRNFSKNHFIILGINDDIYLENNSKIYNSLVIVNRNLDVIELYHKNKLVPFGEFLPFENYLSKLGLRSITNNYKSFSKGNNRKIMKLKNESFDLNFLPLICYEIIYSGNLTKSNDFDFIVNISEDGWFGNSIGLYQHFSHSIFRAIEEGKNIFRSTNNGISAHINGKGKVLKKIESTQGRVIEITNYNKLKQTPFSKFGNKIFFYLLIFYISFVFFINRGK